MLDIKLLDIIQTVCVGVFTLALILYIYFIFIKFFVKNQLDEQEFINWIMQNILNRELKTGFLVVLSILVYFFGIIAGDLTERMTDSNNRKDRSYILKELNYVSDMPSVGELRERALISSDGSLTTLGKSVFNTYPLVKEGNKYNNSGFFVNKSTDSLYAVDSFATVIGKYLKDDKVFSKKDSLPFENFISLMYYSSKNWCYSKEHEPLNELKSIQMRIDMSRSIVLLSTITLQLLVIFYLIFIIINRKKVFPRKTYRTSFKKYFRSVNMISIKSFLLLLMILLICKECFKLCILSYNKRAFGYYVTHLSGLETKKEILKNTDTIYVKEISSKIDTSHNH